MTTFADDIRRIAKQDLPKGGLDAEEVRQTIEGKSVPMLTNESTQSGFVLVSPLVFDALTYDDTKDVTFTDDAGNVQVIKTVATARITDAEGTILDIDTVNFAAPV